MKIFNYNYPLFFIYIIAVLFVGCEKVIDLKLKNSEPKLVIESIFTDSLQIQTVTISQTINFDTKNQTKPVIGANVTISDSQNILANFVENSPGLYQTTIPIKGEPGKKYNLSVTVNNQNYVAASIMPQPVKLDSIRQNEIFIFGKKTKFLKIHYQDPIGLGNYFNNRVFVNNTKIKEYFVEFDRFNDGKQVANSIFLPEPVLVTGDKIKIEMFTIDVNVYKYLFALTQISGNGGPPTAPANPISNFSNSALGYFSASTLSIDSIIIK